MTALGCAEVREKAPELALDVLSGPERAAALEHVSECAACRSLLAEFTEAVDVVPFLAAEAEPPVGFRDRVVQQMTSPPRRWRRRWPAVAVAAVMVAVVVTAAALLVSGRGGSTHSTATGAVRPVAGNARSTAMIGAGDEQVGRLFVTNRDPAVVMVSIEYPVPSGTYTVQQRTDHGTTRLGEMQVNAGHGTWGGVTVTGGHGSVQLIDPNGALLCEAPIPTD